ncbi:MAG TPA: hypothetical protein VGO93_02590 [Candidatus Xenobia bacterium]|jgi:hypothetical protein
MKKVLSLLFLLGVTAHADVVHVALTPPVNPHQARVAGHVLTTRLKAWYLGAPVQPQVDVQGSAVKVDMPSKPAVPPHAILTSPGRVSYRINRGSHDQPRWVVLVQQPLGTPWFRSGRYLGMNRITLQLNPVGAKVLSKASKQALHHEMGLFVDSTLVEAEPVVKVVDTRSPLQLTCSRTMKEADARVLASLLVGGPLPVKAKEQ